MTAFGGLVTRGKDLVAREELIHRLLPLAKSLAARYRHTGESQEDLEQVASLGLIKAIDRYDPELGSLVSYAIPTVIGELRVVGAWRVRYPNRHRKVLAGPAASAEGRATASL